MKGVQGRGLRFAFSLIEILVVVALLSVIIIGLVAMFGQTQRAFVSSMNQTDILASGRESGEMVARDMAQIAPGGAVTFFVTNITANVWPLASPGDVRTNVLDRLYFLTRTKADWKGIRYEAVADANGMATLMRYESPGTNVALVTNGAKVVEGLVSFRVTAYDLSGNLIMTNNTAGSMRTFPALGGPAYIFTGNAVPAYAEVEMGILETRTFQRYLTYSNNAAIALNYLTNHAGQVHVFRQRIPVRAVDPDAYQ